MTRTDNKILALIGFSCTGDLGPMTFYRNKAGKLVWFPRAPALNPPSTVQQYMRQRFNDAARDWRLLSDTDRAAWLHTSKCCGLMITGYNLWVYWRLTHDATALFAIERGCNITLPLT